MKTISDLEDFGSWGCRGGGKRGVTIGHVRNLTVGGRRGEAGCPLGTDGSGGERRRVDERAVSEEEEEVVVGAETVTVTTTETEAKTMTEGGWEDPPATRGIGRDRGRDPAGETAVRGPGVTPPWERRR